ncbi:MAG TPA: sulfatase-like hydrolase/transferase, partial [Solirubrobacterales bacterium]|nr:sulfatase-like hydrolase/transferase [Solirubrobacterales bacterium]
NTAGDIVVFAVALVVVPPLLLLLIEAIWAAVDRRAYRILHMLLIGLIFAVFVVQLEKRVFSGPASVMILLALAAGGLFAFALVRVAFVRSLLDVLAVAPLLFLGLFLFAGDTSELVLPHEEKGALGVKVPSDTPVVVLVFDELPTATLMDQKGDIDRQRYPSFARLARAGTWYRNNTTVADYTGRAVPAIFTGTNPGFNTLPIAASQPNSIFTLLGGTYEMHAEEAVTQICPEVLCGEAERPPQEDRLTGLVDDLKYVEGRLILPPALANGLPNVSTTFGDFGNNAGDAETRGGDFARDLFAPPDPQEFEEFLDTIPAKRRALSLIHMELPHEPWRYFPSGRNWDGRDISNLNTDNAARWAVGSAGIATAQQRHHLQTGYADHLVGQMIDRLQRTGIWDDALVVVTADHGISFTPGIPRRTATATNLGGVTNPPLFIKYPGQRRGKVSQVHSRTIDILPTIAEVLGIEVPFDMEGEPISRRPRGGRIEMLTGGDKQLSEPLSLMIAQRRAIVARTAYRLGTRGILDLGPASYLLGMPAPPLSIGLDPDRVAGVEELGSYEDIDADAEELPAFVAGTLEGIDPGTLIAIALNGRVEGTARAFLDDEEVRYGAVLPPSAFHEGANPVGIYEVSGTALIPLGGS